MKKFVIELFSNRFGIVLAALNLCYFASCGLDSIGRLSGSIFASLNTPAAVPTAITLAVGKLFIRDLSPIDPNTAVALVFSFFIALQWLLVAWSARKLAVRFRKGDLC